MKETWVRKRRGIHGGQGKRGLSQVDTQESREETRPGLGPAAVQYRALKSHHPSVGSKDHEIHWCGVPACSKATLRTDAWEQCWLAYFSVSAQHIRVRTAKFPWDPSGEVSSYFPCQRGFVVSIRCPTWRPALVGLSIPPLV